MANRDTSSVMFRNEGGARRVGKRVAQNEKDCTVSFRFRQTPARASRVARRIMYVARRSTRSEAARLRSRDTALSLFPFLVRHKIYHTR